MGSGRKSRSSKVSGSGRKSQSEVRSQSSRKSIAVYVSMCLRPVAGSTIGIGSQSLVSWDRVESPSGFGGEQSKVVVDRIVMQLIEV